MKINGLFCGRTRCQTAILTPSLASASSRTDKSYFLLERRGGQEQEWGRGRLRLDKFHKSTIPRLGKLFGEFENNPVALQPDSLAGQTQLAEIKPEDLSTSKKIKFSEE